MFVLKRRADARFQPSGQRVSGARYATAALTRDCFYRSRKLVEVSARRRRRTVYFDAESRAQRLTRAATV
jgi:hypothetical protein